VEVHGPAAALRSRDDEGDRATQIARGQRHRPQAGGEVASEAGLELGRTVGTEARATLERRVDEIARHPRLRPTAQGAPLDASVAGPRVARPQIEEAHVGSQAGQRVREVHRPAADHLARDLVAAGARPAHVRGRRQRVLHSQDLRRGRGCQRTVIGRLVRLQSQERGLVEGVVAEGSERHRSETLRDLPHERRGLRRVRPVPERSVGAGDEVRALVEHPRRGRGDHPRRAELEALPVVQRVEVPKAEEAQIRLELGEAALRQQHRKRLVRPTREGRRVEVVEMGVGERDGVHGRKIRDPEAQRRIPLHVSAEDRIAQPRIGQDPRTPHLHQVTRVAEEGEPHDAADPSSRRWKVPVERR